MGLGSEQGCRGQTPPRSRVATLPVPGSRLARTGAGENLYVMDRSSSMGDRKTISATGHGRTSKQGSDKVWTRRELRRWWIFKVTMPRVCKGECERRLISHVGKKG